MLLGRSVLLASLNLVLRALFAVSLRFILKPQTATRSIPVSQSDKLKRYILHKQ